MKTTNNPSDVGGYPLEAEERAAEYGDTAFTVIFFALGTVSSLLGASLTAVQATAALANSGEADTGSNTQHFGWNYSLDELACEAVNFSTFSIECHDGHSTASVETKHRAAQNAGRGNVDVHFWNTVDADPPDDPGCPPGEVCPVDEDEGPEPGTDEYIDYLENSDDFEKVSQDEFSSDHVDVDSDEPVYMAKNPLVRGGLGSHPN